MSDLFVDRAADYDTRPMPAQISAGVVAALEGSIALSLDQTVLDFGAGTGLIATKIADRVARVIAVDISPAMLSQLAAKPDLPANIEPVCHDLVDGALRTQAHVVVSAMALHHVQHTAPMLRALHDELQPGGIFALADLDAEPGTFHPPDIEGVFHNGFDRQVLGHQLVQAGFEDVRFQTACTVTRDGREYPIFLVVARRAGE
ncbi:MAG: class I SAM-dependent methyltransferase [Myxococcota bacterium]